MPHYCPPQADQRSEVLQFTCYIIFYPKLIFLSLKRVNSTPLYCTIYEKQYLCDPEITD